MAEERAVDRGSSTGGDAGASEREAPRLLQPPLTRACLADSGLVTALVFDERVAAALARYPEIARELQAIVRITLSGPRPQVWTLHLLRAPPRVRWGSVTSPDVTVVVDRGACWSWCRRGSPGRGGELPRGGEQDPWRPGLQVQGHPTVGRARPWRAPPGVSWRHSDARVARAAFGHAMLAERETWRRKQGHSEGARKRDV